MQIDAPSASGDFWRARAVGAVVDAAERLWGAPYQLGVPCPAPTAPSRAPDLVVLIDGWGGSGAAWGAWQRSLTRDGIRSIVAGVPNRGMGDIPAAARDIGKAIERARKVTGAARVDLIGFSEGGLTARYLARFVARPGTIDAVITLDSPNHGEGAGYNQNNPVQRAIDRFAGDANAQMRPNSPLLRLLATTPAPTGVRESAIFERPPADATGCAPQRLDAADAVNIMVDDLHEVAGMRAAPAHYVIQHASNEAWQAARRLLDHVPGAAIWHVAPLHDRE